MQELNQFNRN